MKNADVNAITCGQVDGTFTPATLASVMTTHGLDVLHNRYSVRIKNCSHFKFDLFGEAVSIDADADSSNKMINDAQLVSSALTRAGIRHRFEVYGPRDELVAYLHFNWPRKDQNLHET